MMNLDRISIKYRWTIIGLSIAITFASLLFIGELRINSDIESYLPDHIQSKINYDSIESIFGNREPLILIIETANIFSKKTFSNLWDLNEELTQLEDFDRVISIFESNSISGENGNMIVEPLVNFFPSNSYEFDSLKSKIKKDDHYYGRIISKDFTKILFLLNVKSSKSEREIINSLSQKTEEILNDEVYYINGPLYMRTEANDNISRDFILLLPLGLLIMIIFLYLSFRQIKGVLLPFSVVIIAILFSLAMIHLCSWELSIIGILLPVMMIAIANDYGIHFITKYQELSIKNKNESENKIIMRVTNYLQEPIFLTGITTIIGILGLSVHILIPAKQMGLIAAMGIGLALLLSLTFIPATLSIINKKNHKKSFLNNNQNFTNKLLKSISHNFSKKSKMILILFTVLIISSLFGLSGLKIASNFDEILPPSHPHSKALKISNNDFGGSKQISVVINGDIKDPKILNKIISYEKEIKSWEGIGSVNSIATMILDMSRVLNDKNSKAYGVIPPNRNAVAQYLELYSMNGDPEDLETFVDFDYKNAIMEIQFKSENDKSISEIKEKLDVLFSTENNKYLIGAYCLIENEMSEIIATGQFWSLIMALIAIILLLSLIFKSILAGILGAIPLLFSIICTFGLMGWTGIKLDIVTALLSSISIGLGVDYTIHILWRIRKELRNGADLKRSIELSISTSGYGITINAFSVIIGFSVLLFSSFPLIQNFALLISASIIFCLLASIILIPVLCFIIKPKFLFK